MKDVFINIDKEKIHFIAIACFFVFCISTFFYFYDLNKLIPLQNLLTNMWKWKNYVLTGVFNERNILYIGRNLPLIGMIFSLSFVSNKQKRIRISDLLMLIVFVVFSFLNPRREPIVKSIIYVIIPFVIAYRNKIGKLLLIFTPVAILFVFVFAEISKQLYFGEKTFVQSISLYTIGPFCALSKALDVGYPNNTSLPYGNTLYFVYSMLKYLLPNLAPPAITLESLDSSNVNVYTCLIAPLIDSDGVASMLYFNIIFYAIYVGLIITFTIMLYNKYHNVSSIYLLCSCTSSAARAFFNPTFSYTEFFQALIIAIVLSVVFREKFIFDFSKKKQFVFA